MVLHKMLFLSERNQITFKLKYLLNVRTDELHY